MTKKRQRFSVVPANASHPTVGIADRAAAIFQGVYEGASATCEAQGGLSGEAVAEVARGAQEWLTGEVARTQEQWGLPAVACREACAWCCSALSVSAWPLEVFAIAAWLREHRAPEQLTVLAARLREAAADARRQRAASPERPTRVRCALLEGDRCSVYPVRPASCVGWSAADAAPCEAYARGDDASPCKVDPARLFTARAVPLAAATALMDGGGPRFEQDGSGPGGFVDLAGGLAAALERGEGALSEWLAGGTFLAEARAG